MEGRPTPPRTLRRSIYSGLRLTVLPLILLVLARRLVNRRSLLRPLPASSSTKVTFPETCPPYFFASLNPPPPPLLIRLLSSANAHPTSRKRPPSFCPPRLPVHISDSDFLFASFSAQRNRRGPPHSSVDAETHKRSSETTSRRKSSSSSSHWTRGGDCVCVSIMTPSSEIRPPNFADMAFSSPFLPPSLPDFASQPSSHVPLPSVKAGDGQNRTHHSQTPPPTFGASNELWRRASVARTALQAAIFRGALNHAHFTSHRGITIAADRWMASSRVSDSPSLLLLLPPSAASSTLFPRTAAMN